MQKIKIGVFDSGVGGQSVVSAIKKNLPQLDIVYKDDKKHVPYGNRSIKEIYSFVKPIFQSFVDEGCKLIVIACNTVTTNLMDQLKKDFSVPMIGMEPLVKEAATSTKTGVIAVCATPRTLESKRYNWLKKQYAQRIKVLEPNCSDWAYMVEHNRVNREKIAKIIEDSVVAGADRIVLGCTHYHWIKDLIQATANGRAEVIQPEQSVIRQLKKAISRL
jgi:glutamate racemase